MDISQCTLISVNISTKFIVFLSVQRKRIHPVTALYFHISYTLCSDHRMSFKRSLKNGTYSYLEKVSEISKSFRIHDLFYYLLEMIILNSHFS